MSNAQRVFKNTIALSIANSLPRVTQAVVIFVAARVIGDVGLGKYYTIASLIAITNLVTDLGLTSSFTREVSKKKEEASKYFFNFFIVKLFLGLVAYGTLILLTFSLNYSVDILKAAYLYGLFMVFWGISGFFQALFQAFEEMKYTAWMSIMSSLLNLVISVSLLYTRGNFMSPIWGLVGGAVVAFIIGLLIVRNMITFSFSYFDWPFLKKNLKLTIPYALNSLFASVYFRIDSIILSKLETEQVMGWYGAAYKLLDNLLMFPQFFLGAVYPVFCRIHDESQEKLSELFAQSFKILSMGAFPIAIGLFLTAKKVMMLLYGPDFTPGVLTLQILTLALFMIFFTSLGVTTLMAMNRMKVVNLVGAFNIVLNVCLSFLLIPKSGFGLSLQGAAIATVACELTGVIVFMLYFLKIKMIRRDMLNYLYKPIIAAIVMAFAVYFTLSFNLLVNVGVGMSVYFLILWGLKGFSDKELSVIKGFIKR